MTVNNAIQILADEAERLQGNADDTNGVVRALVTAHGFGFEAWLCVCCEIADRNARRLCDVCDDLLTESEHRDRDIAFFVADTASKAARTLASMKPKPRRCIKRDTTNDDRTCAERKVIAFCAFCVSQMTERQLIKHAEKVIDDREKQRHYWQETDEAQDYADELRAKGFLSIEWNLEQSQDMDSMYIRYTLFLFSRPCWQHPETA